MRISILAALSLALILLGAACQRHTHPAEGSAQSPTVAQTKPHGPRAKLADSVIVDYTGRLDDGSVFDTTEGRAPLQLTIGMHQVMPGFERAVVGMRAAESKTVRIPAKDAYGPYRKELVLVVNRSDIPPEETLAIGKQVAGRLPNGSIAPYTITAITDTTITMDGNGPMAGKTLTFDLHLLQVIKPQPAARPPETAQPVAPSPTVTQPNAPTETAATPQGPPAQAGDTVRAEYTGKLDDGTVFDSSEKRGPIQFTIGAHQVIPGFEQAVTGMKAGESKTVRIPPDQAYGPHRDELVRVVNRKDLPSGETLQVGKQTPWPGPNGRAETATVTALSKSTVTLDTNHPLAGKTLTFHLHLLQIIKPPAPPM